MLDILFPSEMCEFSFFSGWPIPLALPPLILLLHEEIILDETDKYFKLDFNYWENKCDINEVKIK